MKVLMMGATSIVNPDNGFKNHIASILNEFELAGEPIEYLSVALNDGNYRSGFLHKVTRYTNRISPIYLARVLLALYKKKPDIIHMQGMGITPGLYAYILYKGRAKKVVTIHGFNSDELVAHGLVKAGSFIHRYAKKVEDLALKTSDTIIAVDKEKESRILNAHLAPKTHLVTINNGYDNNTFDPNRFCQTDRDTTRRALGIALTDLLLIEVKALQTNNGQEMLLRVMPQLVKNHPEVKLILVGDGPEESHLKKITEELGIQQYVRFLGNRPHRDIPLLLYSCDICVLPSRRVGGVNEGSSVFLMESMGMGKPIIASNVGGNIDTIADGITGLLFSESSIKELEERLIYMINREDIRIVLSSNARNYAHEMSWAKIASQLKEQYNQTLRA